MNEQKRKEYMNYLKKREYDEWFPFECISKRISFLMMFTRIIDNHPNELEPSYQSESKKWGFKPSEPLIDFILLDIRNFYQTAHKKFRNNIEYPKSWEAVRKIRNDAIGHFTKDAPKEVVELYEEIQKIGFKKIYSDFKKFRDKIEKIVSKKC